MSEYYQRRFVLVSATQSCNRAATMATSHEILRVLDRGAEAFVFPMLDNGFVQLADVLASGNVAGYAPGAEPNTDWRFWPNGGTL